MVDPNELVEDPEGSRRLIETGKALRDSSDLIEKTSIRSGYGSINAAITAAFYGHNITSTGSPTPLNNDHRGYFFLTRPRMNLTYNNVIKDTCMTTLLAGGEGRNTSIQGAIRAYLDPVSSKTLFPSTMVNPEYPFIPLLDNHLLTASGWPDPIAGVYTSTAGLYGEELSFVDGHSKIYSAYDLSLSFRNIINDPITYMFQIWIMYASLVHEGVMDPYPEHIQFNEIDYNTRGYRLVMDPTNQFVTKFGACGAAFPVTVPFGSMMNYDASKTYDDNNDQIAITLRCNGAIYNDPVLVEDFNILVEDFCPLMLTEETRRAYMVEVKPNMRKIFNNMAYPRIEPDMRLRWFVKKVDYDIRMRGLNG